MSRFYDGAAGSVVRKRTALGAGSCGDGRPRRRLIQLVSSSLRGTGADTPCHDGGRRRDLFSVRPELRSSGASSI